MKKFEYFDTHCVGDYEYGTLYLGEPDEIKAIHKSMKRAWWNNDKFALVPQYEEVNYKKNWLGLLVVTESSYSSNNIGFSLVSNEFIVECFRDGYLKEIQK